ncbi:MAG: hypothetical protein WDM92_07870 [Caulobacteraceae bacterium]
MSPDWNVYLEGNYGYSETSYRGILSSSATHQAIPIFADNAYLSPQIRAALGSTSSFTLGRIDTDFPYHREFSVYDMTRGVFGVDGKLGIWNVKALREHGESIHGTDSAGNVILSKFYDAVDAVVAPAGITGVTPGSIVCRTTLTTRGNGCIPLNVMGPTAANAAAIAAVTGTASLHQYLSQDVADFAISGAPFSSWAGPISIGGGATYRRESASGPGGRDLHRLQSRRPRNAAVQAGPDAGADRQRQSHPGGPARPARRLRIGQHRLAARLLRRQGSLRRDPGAAGQGHDLRPVARPERGDPLRRLQHQRRRHELEDRGGLSADRRLRIRATRSRDDRGANLAELYQGVLAKQRGRLRSLPQQRDQREPSDPQLRQLEAQGRAERHLYGGGGLPAELVPGLQRIGRLLRHRGEERDPAARGPGRDQRLQARRSRPVQPDLPRHRPVHLHQRRRPDRGCRQPLRERGLGETSGVDIEATYRSELSRFSPSLPGAFGIHLLANYVHNLTTAVRARPR